MKNNQNKRIPKQSIKCYQNQIFSLQSQNQEKQRFFIDILESLKKNMTQNRVDFLLNYLLISNSKNPILKNQIKKIVPNDKKQLKDKENMIEQIDPNLFRYQNNMEVEKINRRIKTQQQQCSTTSKNKICQIYYNHQISYGFNQTIKKQNYSPILSQFNENQDKFLKSVRFKILVKNNKQNHYQKIKINTQKQEDKNIPEKFIKKLKRIQVNKQKNIMIKPQQNRFSQF